MSRINGNSAMGAHFRSTVAALVVLVNAAAAAAQGVEAAPFIGYRFGGDFFELATGRAVDADGAPAAGVVVDIPLYDRFQIEALFTHQRARVTTVTLFGDQARWDVTVDHWQAGAVQEFGRTRVRPFLSGLVGLTRYGLDNDSEMRFAVAGGGGVKLFPSRHLGVRLDGRLFATFVDIGGRALACPVSPCVVALDVDVVWQAEFSAGLVVRLP